MYTYIYTYIGVKSKKMEHFDFLNFLNLSFAVWLFRLISHFSFLLEIKNGLIFQQTTLESFIKICLFYNGGIFA